MAEATISGEFRYGANWDASDSLYSGELDRMRIVFSSQLDDFNYLETRVNRDGSNGVADSISDDGVAFNHAFVTTDWGKYFGFAESGFGLSTTVGSDEWEAYDALSYTIYDFGGPEPCTGDKMGMRVDMDIMGIVKPYVATTFAEGFSGPADTASYMIGSAVDFAPIWAEVYFLQTGIAENDRMFGLEAEFASEVADGVALKVGGALTMTNPADEWTYGYLFGAGVGAYGAQVDVTLGGQEDYALGKMALSAKYDILKWLGVQAGMQMAFGDYATDFQNDEAFAGAEFGLYVKPGKVQYGLGYIVANEDAAAYSAHDGFAPDINPKGGIYFDVKAKF